MGPAAKSMADCRDYCLGLSIRIMTITTKTAAAIPDPRRRFSEV